SAERCKNKKGIRHTLELRRFGESAAHARFQTEPRLAGLSARRATVSQPRFCAVNSEPVTPPFFYGWIIVAISMLAGFFSAGVSNITMAVVLKPISDELGWSRALTAAAVRAGGISGGGLAPFFGPIADRLGPRLLLPAGGTLVGLLAIGVGLSTEPWQFYATFVPARALTAFLLCGIVPFTAVANWFYIKRPRAMGLVAARGVGSVARLPILCRSLRLAQRFFSAVDSGGDTWRDFPAATTGRSRPHSRRGFSHASI